MIKITQKILILLLLVPMLFVVSCKDNDDNDDIENKDPEINNGEKDPEENENPFIPTLSIDESTLKPRYYYLEFDLSSITVIDNYEKDKINKVSWKIIISKNFFCYWIYK